jgi:hypothetical protein
MLRRTARAASSCLTHRAKVHVEQRGVGALSDEALAARERAVDELHAVDDHRQHALAQRVELLPLGGAVNVD